MPTVNYDFRGLPICSPTETYNSLATKFRYAKFPRKCSILGWDHVAWYLCQPDPIETIKSNLALSNVRMQTDRDPETAALRASTNAAYGLLLRRVRTLLSTKG